MIYVDPLKLEAHNLSLMDVVKAVNDSNLILPAGDVRIGSKDYNIYANSQVPTPEQMNDMPLKSVGNASVLVGDIGRAEDSGAIQNNIVRIDGQRSVYIPILKQGGDSNTITIVDGMKAAIKNLVDIPSQLKTAVVFDQSIFVKFAIKNLLKEAAIGLVLTGMMILVFLGSPRATFAVLLSIPLSALVCLLIMDTMGGSINTMLLGGLALAFSRLSTTRLSCSKTSSVTWRWARRRVRQQRRGDGGLASCAGSDIHHFHRLFPGHIFRRGQQIHFH